MSVGPHYHKVGEADLAVKVPMLCGALRLAVSRTTLPPLYSRLEAGDVCGTAHGAVCAPIGDVFCSLHASGISAFRIRRFFERHGVTRTSAFGLDKLEADLTAMRRNGPISLEAFAALVVHVAHQLYPDSSPREALRVILQGPLS